MMVMIIIMITIVVEVLTTTIFLINLKLVEEKNREVLIVKIREKV